jgi:hypothetical protein
MAHHRRAVLDLNSAAGVIPAYIAPLVRRHVEDAAFYWLQLDGSLAAVQLNASHAKHFSGLLAAHLDGVALSGDIGLNLALSALQRWKKPGEAFVAMWAALVAHDEQAQARVMQVVMTQPDLMLRGVVAALAAAPEQNAVSWVAQARAGGEPVHLVAALRAGALRAWPIADWVGMVAHANAHVRAAACRCAKTTHLASLEPLLADADLAVRAEAAIRQAQLLGLAKAGMASTPQTLQAASVLWQCVAAQATVASTATGWNKTLSQRRLNRWLRHLAWMAPLGHPHIATLLAHLPLRSALTFTLAHGDPAHLPFVVKALQDPQQARWAGWVWQTLTGIDLQHNGLTLPNPPADPSIGLTRAQQDADQGLPLPHPAAIAAHPANPLKPANPSAQAARMLMGQAVNMSNLAKLLSMQTDAPQALRAVAAHALSWLQPQAPINLRASASIQTQQLRQLAALQAP